MSTLHTHWQHLALPRRGYSLVEMMVSLTIGLAITSALLTLFLHSNSSSITNKYTSELLNAGRYALNSMKADVRQAGFRGFTDIPPDPPNSPLSTVITPIDNECLEPGASAGAFISNIWQGIWGADDKNPFAQGKNCLSDYARGDVLVVRRLHPMPATALDVDTLYFRTHYNKGEVFRGSPTSACDAGSFPISAYPAPYNKYPCIAGTANVDLLNFPIITHIYYIRSYSASNNEYPKIPALARVTLQTDGSMASELVASGIENMQIQYGTTHADLSNQYVDANSISGNSYLSNTSATAWNDVNSVRIWLLARNANEEPAYSNTTTYAMGNANITVADGYRRQVFSTSVSLRNKKPE